MFSFHLTFPDSLKAASASLLKRTLLHRSWLVKNVPKSCLPSQESFSCYLITLPGTAKSFPFWRTTVPFPPDWLYSVFLLAFVEKLLNVFLPICTIIYKFRVQAHYQLQGAQSCADALCKGRTCSYLGFALPWDLFPGWNQQHFIQNTRSPLRTRCWKVRQLFHILWPFWYLKATLSTLRPYQWPRFLS